MISYAQNLEDVVLNRVFQNKPNGFYIDVGAHNPIELSVTKHFYDLGWHGINIEPVPASYEKFKKERPDDINLNIALGLKHDFTTIYEIEGHPELTSLNKSIAESAGKLMGARVKPYTVEIRTLTDICEQYCVGFIDFIKIDVEGFEKNVILGADLKRFRPTMLVIEATKPCEAIIESWDNPEAAAAWREWEPLLFEADYILTYYDGLNRYYLRKEDEHLKNRFTIPVTWIQDQFSLYRDVRETWRLDAENKQLEEERSELLKQRDQLKNNEKELEQRFSVLNAEHNSLSAEKMQLEEERSELLKERDQLKNRETDLIFEIEKLGTARDRLVEENSNQHVYILEFKKQEEGLRKERDKLIAKSEGHRKRQAELQKELANSQHEFTILKAVHEDERFIRRRNPVQGFFDLLKPLFPIKEMQDVHKAEVTAGPIQSAPAAAEAKDSKSFPEANGTAITTIPKSKTNESSEIKQTKNEDLTCELNTLRVTEFDKEGLSPEKEWDHEDNSAKQGPETSSPCPEYAHPMLGADWDKLASIARKEVEGTGLVFVPVLELEMVEGRELPREQWVAISHVPTRLPNWMAETKVYKPFTTALLSSKVLKTVKLHCQRLFAFSEDHAQALNNQTGLKTTALKLPQPEVAKRWSWEAFKVNPEKEIIQVGWWLMRMHGIYLLPESRYKKLWIRIPEPNTDDVFAAERIYLKERFIFFDHMDNSVTVWDHLPSKDYEKRLSANIGFVHYYDASAPDFLLQCIARHTPILINPLPAVREYLGNGYPLYYYFYKDAVKKASNYDLVHKAHEYLAELSGKMDVNPERFASQVRNALEED